MLNTITETEIILSAWRGFFGLISNKTRAITIDWDKNEAFIKLKVFLEPDASEDIIDNMDIAYTNIIADFNFKKNYEIEYVLSDEDINNIKGYKLWFYIRSEDNSPLALVCNECRVQ